MENNEKEFGTPSKYLYRNTDPETSKEAAESVDTSALEKMVYEKVKSYEEDGCIADDLLTFFNNFPYSSITARFSSLERKHFITRLGDKRKGRSGRNQLVMRAA